MKFGPVPTDDAEGAILAHAAHLPDGRLRKGTRLTAAELERLRSAGIAEIIVARLEAGDIDEDAAADRLAAALMPPGLRLSQAATGRVNIYAVGRGIVRFDRDRLKQVNRIDEGITLACVQHNQLVEDGDMIATLKIIPYAVRQDTVEAVERQAAGAPVLGFHRLTARPFALIQTRMEGMKPSLLTSTEKVTKQRLNQLGCALVDSRVVAHDSAAVVEAIAAARKHGAEAVLICGASAISDRRDIVPAAVEQAGGRIDRLGLPADPGNLLMTASLDGMPVIGMPGCARSPRLNGFDWVLQLVLAGLPLDDDEIADMAIGGLLMEIASRPLPRRMVEQRRSDAIAIGGVSLPPACLGAWGTGTSYLPKSPVCRWCGARPRPWSRAAFASLLSSPDMRRMRWRRRSRASRRRAWNCGSCTMAISPKVRPDRSPPACRHCRRLSPAPSSPLETCPLSRPGWLPR